MAAKIRLKRFGKKRNPFYRIVIMDSRKARDGQAIEEIGIYHPTRQPSVIEVNSERALYWLTVGAQPSDTVQKLLELTGDWGKFKGDKNAKSTVKEQPKPLTPEEKIAKAADEAEKLKLEKQKAKLEAERKAAEDAKAAEAVAKAESEAATAESNTDEVADTAESSEETSPIAADKTSEESSATAESTSEVEGTDGVSNEEGDAA